MISSILICIILTFYTCDLVIVDLFVDILLFDIILHSHTVTYESCFTSTFIFYYSLYSNTTDCSFDNCVLFKCH